MGMKPVAGARSERSEQVSVLNREPMGMKRIETNFGKPNIYVSVLNREPMGMKLKPSAKWRSS